MSSLSLTKVLEFPGDGNIQITPDGSFIVLDNLTDSRLYFHDSQSGALIHTFYKRQPDFQIRFSPTERVFALSSPTTAIIQFYSLDSMNYLGQLDLSSKRVQRILDYQYSPDGKRIAARCHNGPQTIRIYDLQHKQVLNYIHVPFDIECFQYSTDGQHLAIKESSHSPEVPGRQRIYIYHTRKGKLIRQIIEDVNYLSRMIYTPNGKWLIYSTSDTIHVLSADNYQLLHTLDIPSDNRRMYFPRLSYDSQYLYLCEAIWDMEAKTILPNKLGHLPYFFPETLRFVTREDGVVKVWHFRKFGRLIKFAQKR